MFQKECNHGEHICTDGKGYSSMEDCIRCKPAPQPKEVWEKDLVKFCNDNGLSGIEYKEK